MPLAPAHLTVTTRQAVDQEEAALMAALHASVERATGCKSGNCETCLRRFEEAAANERTSITATETNMKP